MRSFRKQVMITILTAETLCGAIFGGVVLAHEWRVRVRALDTAIRGRSDSLLGAIQDAEDPEDNVFVDPTELEVPRGDIYAVYNQHGRLLGTSNLAPSAIIARRRTGVSMQTYDGCTYRVLQRDGMRIIDRNENNGVGLRRPVTIIYAVPSGHIWHEVLESVGFYLAAGATLLLLTGAIIIVLMRRIMLPLQELASQAGTISPRSLSFSPPRSSLETEELKPLAESLAEMTRGLRHAFEQQTRFVGDAAHELKTAVAVVRSSVQLLLLRPRHSPEYVAGLQTVLIDNTRVEELVTRMLLSARFAEKASEAHAISTKTASLTGTLRRTLARLQSILAKNAVSVRLYSTVDLSVRLSSEELEVLASNLIVNAVQHSAGGMEVSITVSERSGFAEIHVKDTGEGISAEALPHVFDRFFREDRSRARDTGGAGLGLAICQSIVESAGGRIMIESTRNVGTLVTVCLPLAERPGTLVHSTSHGVDVEAEF